ncbi:Glutamate synthase [NADPH] large chain [Myxococcus hansupus]|uniref:Glutamate synthase [NADPH] large chain n=1 Tax=Pseudomyxococcus hansupus TaxID=1297742 RepID=A0A0H4WXW0_9BACT|nr:ribonuclease H-like domain-containing protein [Myxococcus hansupus]AKQ66175.1 Glutamate synthase [NADPH] large chain [Myxococcus hansupus]
MDLKRKLSRLTSVGPGGKAPSRPAVPAPTSEPAAGTSSVAGEPSSLRAQTSLDEAGQRAPSESGSHGGEGAENLRPTDAAPHGTAARNVAQGAGLVGNPFATQTLEGTAPLRVPSSAETSPEVSQSRDAALRASTSAALEATPSSPAARDPRVDALRRMLSDWSERQELAAARRGATPAPPRGPLPVEARTTTYGTVHVSERIHPPDHRHGSAPVAAALDVEGSLVASLALHADLAGVDYQRMLFLDTETTGLAGGTGTVPFLVGLAWFEGRSLKVHQLFLRRLGEEGPMLRALAERMAASSCLVTFNGKSFDWPLLRTRFVLNRVAAPAELPHLDLLHCARRVFKHRGAGTRLVHLEDQVLGFRRVDDVDGSQIPELYFRYLRGGDGSALTPVLEHNINDLLLLAALLGELVRRFRAGGEGAAVPRSEDPRDLLGFAGVALRARDYERAQAFARAAAAGDRGAVGIEALALASRLSRKAGDAPSAATHLHRALEAARGFQAATLHLDLSKLYEHALKDLAKALHHAKLSKAAETPPDHQRRVVRLEARIARSTRTPALDLRMGLGSPRSGT